jgi:hypothetical protein
MQPMLIDLPEAFESDRLILRCPRPGDGPNLFGATVDALAALRKFPASLPWALDEPSVELSESFCTRGFVNFVERRDFPLLFIEKSTGSVIGAGGLHRPRWAVPAFEMGFWGRTSFCGQGFFSEATAAILKFAFSHMKARRVEALCDDLNKESCRVCERIGMQLEGVLRQERRAPDGQLRDTRVYSRVS